MRSSPKPSRKPIRPLTTRRKFLAGAAAMSAAALAACGKAQPPAKPAVPTAVPGPTPHAAPAVASGPITLRWQSTWPAKDIFHEYALDYAKKVNDMAGGKLRIEVLPAGSVVKPFDLIDAVSKGVLDGGHGVTAYWYGKSAAVALWGSGPAFGMDANLVLAWHYYGGGRALLEEVYKDLNLDVVSFLYGPMPTQPLGWFKKPIAGPADFKGLKYRAAGLSVDIFAKLGAAVSALPGGDIVAAMDKGLIDAAEFNNATSDRLLGLPDAAKICMLQSYHQPGEQFEILFNRKRYDSLPGELKAILRYAVEAASADMSWKAAYRYANDYFELRTRDNVRFDKTPDTILQAQLAAWDEVAAKKSEENPHFKRIYESQREFAERVVRWQHDTTVDSRLAYDHFFGNRKA